MPEPWTCTQCGECCRTTPFVVVTDAERALLDARGPATYTPDPAPGFQRLMAAPCPFYDQGCTVYDVRPYNCRRYASMKGYTGTERNARRYQVQLQKKAQRWATQHGWVAPHA